MIEKYSSSLSQKNYMVSSSLLKKSRIICTLYYVLVIKMTQLILISVHVLLVTSNYYEKVSVGVFLLI